MKTPEIFFVGPKGEYSDKVQYGTIQEAYDFLLGEMVVGIDIETSPKFKLGTFPNENIYKPGIDPFLSVVIMLQVGTVDKIYVIDVRTVDISILIPLFEDKNRVWSGVNLKFEAKHLLHNYGILFHKIWDCMLCEQNLTNGLERSKTNPGGFSYSLAAMAERYLGIKPAEKKEVKDLFSPVDEEDENEEDVIQIDKSIRMGFLKIGDKPFSEEQILYGAGDIEYPLRIKELQQAHGYNGYNPTLVHELENEYCLVLADIELSGIPFDKNKWLENFEANKIVYNKRKEKLDNWVVENHKDFCRSPELFNPNYTCAIEWSSSKQVIKLFKKLGFCPQEKSKDTGYIEYTVGAKSLTKLLPSNMKEMYMSDKECGPIEDNNTLILSYLLLSTAEQAITTFGDKFLKYVHPITGKLHSSYKQIMHSGRISSSKPNSQNITNKPGYRKAFIAGEGNVLVNADYSGQESRVIADLAEEPIMISFFNNGHPIHGNDMHSLVATKMFSLMRNEPNLIISKKTHPKERTDAKNISFKIAYGGSAHTLKDDFGVTVEVAQEFIDSYLGAFPSLDKYFKKRHKEAQENGYITILPDRRYWEASWQRMKDLSKAVWSYYPDNYRKMTQAQRTDVKEKIKYEHPEVKRMWSEFFVIQGSLNRLSQNLPVQGCAGAQTKLAGVLFRKYQIDNHLRGNIWLNMVIHDEMVAECKKEFAEEGRKLIEKCMVDGANHYMKHVRMEAVAEVTSFWSH